MGWGDRSKIQHNPLAHAHAGRTQRAGADGQESLVMPRQSAAAQLSRYTEVSPALYC